MIALKYAELYEDDIKKGSLPNMKTTGPSGSYQMDSSESIYIDASGLPVLADAHGTYDPSAYVGRFKSGLTRVPSDNYVAVLHEGERVLTAQEAKAYNDLSSYAVEQLSNDMVSNYSTVSEGNSVMQNVITSAFDSSDITDSINGQTSSIESKLDAILTAIQSLVGAMRGTPRPMNANTDIRRMNSNMTSVNTGF